MNIPQYLARCAQLGIVPLEHTPPPAAPTDHETVNGWWLVLLVAIALVSAFCIVSLLVFAEKSKHGGYLLAALIALIIGIAAYLHNQDASGPTP